MDMARRRIDLRLDEDFLARVDAEAKKLGQTRTKFVERALESALDFEACLPKPPASSKWVDVEAHKAVHRDFAKSVSRDAMDRQRKLNEGKG